MSRPQPHPVSRRQPVSKSCISGSQEQMEATAKCVSVDRSVCPPQDALLECVRKRVPVLLSRGMVRLVVVDSVAAPFRCEYDVQALATRAKHLQSLGATLRGLSSTFRSPVLCINQVGGVGLCTSPWGRGSALHRGGQGSALHLALGGGADGEAAEVAAVMTLPWVFPGDGNGGGASVCVQAPGVSMAPRIRVLEGVGYTQAPAPTHFVSQGLGRAPLSSPRHHLGQPDPDETDG